MARRFRARITYEVITHESAEHGEPESHGWWMPGGWEYALYDAEGEHRELLEQAQAGDFDLTLGEAIRAAIELGCSEVRQVGHAVWARSVDAPIGRANLERGEERYYMVYCDGCSSGTLARIVRLLKGEAI